MTKEHSFFLQILSDHLNGRPTTQQETIDWTVVMTLAQNQQVNGIIYHQCKGFLPDEAKKTLEKKYSSELYFYFNRMALYKQLKQAFSAAEIPFYSVKGLIVSQYYPVPALRTMGDCDIVVHTEDKEKVHTILTDLGFNNTLKENKEWIYYKNQMEFEIHDHLLYNKPINTESSRMLTDQVAWEKAAPTGAGSCCELDWSFHFLFLLLHLRQHIIHCGAGFRQFMDLAVVLQNCNLDWVWLRKTIDELELWPFSEVCLALLKRWFEIAPPLELAEFDNAFYEEVTDKIIENGVFGFNDETNRKSSKMNAIIWQRGPLWWIRMRVLLASIFPPYQIMRYVPHYAFVDRRPWLIPVAWIYRFYRSIRYRMAAKGKHMLDNAMIPNDRLEARKDALAKWGL